MSRPLCLHPLALTPWDRVVLFADEILAFRPGSAPAGEVGGKNYRRKRTSKYGRIRGAARDFLDSRTGLTMTEFANDKNLDYESFKAAVWKLRREREGAA